MAFFWRPRAFFGLPITDKFNFFLDNNNKQTMIITTQKYQTINITKLINTLNLNFIILNNKLIFTHKITSKNLKDIEKLLKNKYSTSYKIYKQ